MSKDIGWLAALALEFFLGEALYGMEESLRHLRKWRLITVSIPLLGLIMVVWCAVAWPQAEAINARDIGRLEFKVEQLDKLAEQQRQALEKFHDEMSLKGITVIEMKGQIETINHKLDLVGWLIGAAAVAFVGQSISYFYQLRLRKTLRGIEKREQ